MLDDRDRELLEAIEHIGPVTPHALAFHSIEGRFETDAELEERLGVLVEEGHLRENAVVDVSGDSITEYTIDD